MSEQDRRISEENAWFDEKSDEELDLFMEQQRELLLHDTKYLENTFSSLIPEVNEDVQALYTSLGLPVAPPLSSKNVFYFDTKHGFAMEQHGESDSLAFERNGSIFIGLADVQEMLQVYDTAMGERTYSGVPKTYAFFVVATRFMQTVLNHENLHRIHFLTQGEVPTDVKEALVNWTAGLLEDLESEEDEPTNDMSLFFRQRLGRVQQEHEAGNLKVIQEGALLLFRTNDGELLYPIGDKINEGLVQHVARELTFRRIGDVPQAEFFKNLFARMSQFPSDIMAEFLNMQEQEQLKRYLDGHFFDDMFQTIDEREAVRFLSLVGGQPKFFSDNQEQATEENNA